VWCCLPVGERDFAADNKILGTFDLVGIPPASRGVPQIEVTFDIDANGIVHVTARDKVTGKEHTITIESSGGLNDAEVEKMVREAEKNAEKDKKKREFIVMRNSAESIIYSTEKSLKEHNEKIPANLTALVEKEIAGLKSAMETEMETEKLKAKVDVLQQAAMKIGEAVYKGAANGGGGGGRVSREDASGEDQKNDEKMKDAEYEEKTKQ
jgi:molecular chaperone DnaK